jgi:hypothetical protein
MKIVRKIIHDLIMILVPKALRKNMLTCEQVALIIAEKLNYKNQIKIIDSESKNLGKINLTDSQKQKIIKSRSEISKKYSK